MTDVTGLLKDGDDEGEPTSPHNFKISQPQKSVIGVEDIEGIAVHNPADLAGEGVGEGRCPDDNQDSQRK